MTSTDNVIGQIDATLGHVSNDVLSHDAMRWAPAEPGGLRVLLIPVDTAQSVRVVDLPRDESGSILAGLYQVIGCDLIEMVHPVEDVDFVIDEEGSPLCKPDAEYNLRANYLLRVLKFAQATGHYPAPGGVPRRELLSEALAWREQVHLFGTVVVIGINERTGDSVSVPQQLLDFAEKVPEVLVEFVGEPLEVWVV